MRYSLSIHREHGSDGFLRRGLRGCGRGGSTGESLSFVLPRIYHQAPDTHTNQGCNNDRQADYGKVNPNPLRAVIFACRVTSAIPSHVGYLLPSSPKRRFNVVGQSGQFGLQRRPVKCVPCHSPGLMHHESRSGGGVYAGRFIVVRGMFFALVWEY